MMKVTPSILTSPVEDTIAQIQRLRPYFRHFQIDVCDGTFVPTKTASVIDIVKYAATHQSTLDREISLDFDLMVEDYKKSLGDLEMLASYVHIDTVFFHFKSLKNDALPTHHLFTMGIALDPDDTAEQLAHHYSIKYLPAVQIMTVTPGYQGSPFLPEMLDKIDQLKELNYKNKIYVDGAVNAKTIPLLKNRQNPPDVIGPGSYLSKAENLDERVKELNTLLK